jgi:c-di-GMP-related signal transduction protein
MKTHEIETDDLYEQIRSEMDHLGGILSIVECLGASEYQGMDNTMETLLKNNRNGFMSVMYDAINRHEKALKLMRELGERIIVKKAA